MHSCLYEGIVTHSRYEPVAHRFQYRLFMVYLDLDELPSLVGSRRLIASRRYASRSFLRSDHLYDSSQPLATEIREVIQSETGESPRGPIRLLTQLRCFGYYMSPLNLFYVFDEGGEHVDYVVAEVNNTPWKERHCYVLWDGNRAATAPLEFNHNKGFHVSPFMAMELEYRWRLTEPGEDLAIALANRHGSRKLFDANLTLQRHELSRPKLNRMSLRYPLMTATISAAIYYQALRLWWKKCPFYTHPQRPHKSPDPTPAPPR